MASEHTSLPLNTMLHLINIRISSTNYLLWREQVYTMLKCDGLHVFLDGSSPESPAFLPPIVASSPDVAPAVVPPIGDKSTSLPNPAHPIWVRRHDQVLSLLFSSLSEEAMSEVIGLRSAAAVWSALEAAFSPNTPSRANQLRDELQFLQRGNQSVSDFGRRFKSLCHQLAAIGHTVSDADKCRWFLRGLGPEFRSFVDLRLALPFPLVFNDLISQARDQELRDKANSVADAVPTAVAFFSQRGGSGRGSSSARPQGRGTSSPGFQGNSSLGRGSSSGFGRGHTSPTFQGTSGRGHTPGSASTGSGRGASQPYRRPPRCQICQGAHYANHCPDRYKRPSSDSANLAQAFGAQCSINSSPSDWYVDTGATAHITSSADALDEFAPYTESNNKANSSTGAV